jgi:hypothetical protein
MGNSRCSEPMVMAWVFTIVPCYNAHPELSARNTVQHAISKDSEFASRTVFLDSSLEILSQRLI